MLKLKQKTINIFLYVLISLEAIYVVSVYFPIYGIQGIIAGLIYGSIAIVHIYAPSKKLSTVVLIISIGIAIPRLLVTIENRIDDRRKEAIANITVEEGSEEEPIKPIFSDCSKLPNWEGAKIRDCQLNNDTNQSNYLSRVDEHRRTLKDYAELKSLTKISIPLTLSDYGSMIMFMILSGSLPTVIYLLLLESSEIAAIPEAHERRKKEQSIVKEAVSLYFNNVPVKEILDKYEGQLSKTTLYKYLKINRATHTKK
jgi:hypothetical protein